MNGSNTAKKIMPCHALLVGACAPSYNSTRGLAVRALPRFISARTLDLERPSFHIWMSTWLGTTWFLYPQTDFQAARLVWQSRALTERWQEGTSGPKRLKNNKVRRLKRSTPATLQAGNGKPPFGFLT